MLRLWKYNRITGYWVVARTVTKETAKQWLRVWEASEPKEIFKSSKVHPKLLCKKRD